MKRKKILGKISAIVLGAVTAAGCFSLTACAHQHTYSSEWSSDETYHWHAPTCDDTTEGIDKVEHTWDVGFCTVCHAENANPAYYTATSADDTDNDESVPTYQDETGAATKVEPLVPEYKGAAPALVAGTQNVDYVRNIGDLDAGKLTADWTDGIFTVPAGTEVRTRNRPAKDEITFTKSLKLGEGSLDLNASGAGTLVVYVDNGSSGVTSAGIIVSGPDGDDAIDYDKGAKSVKLTINIPKAGKYSVKRDASKNSTTDLYYAKFSAEVENAPISGIRISNAGTANYYVGQQLDCTGIAVTATHDNNMVSPVSNDNIQVDASKFDSTTPGSYEISVTYNIEGNLTSSTTTFTTSYTVNVYSFDGFELGRDKIEKSSTNTTAGNGVYFNHTVRQFYFKGETFSTDGLSVILKGKLNESTEEFILPASAYSVTAPDLTSTGKKTAKVSVTVNGVTKSLGFNVYVAEKDAALSSATSVKLAVNPEFSTKNIGVKNAVGAYRFKTIQQALDFLNASGIADTATKTIYLADGTYNEKLEVTVPNLTIIGAGKDKAKIEYDALYGVKDAGGFEHTTDSTATLNVREEATGFTIKNVTVSNYYNSVESYNGAPSTDRRALAVLIQADKVTFDGCALLGYQDTLELFKGRQLFKNCYISGTTDFIFGTNNTTYFYQCEIHAISNGKDNDGGYITAFKGSNKDASDSVTYGAIFDECNFTAPESEVSKGTTAIGRPWSAYAAVAVINSNIGGHVAKTCSGTASKNERYVTMNAKPTDATVKFVEYNNTGDGAITTAVTGMKILSEAEAKNYSDFAVIFGTTNGNVSYADAWNPAK